MERRNPSGRESLAFYLPVLFEGDVSWQRRRGLKINVAKGGSDSLSAGCGSLGWPDWSWMSLLLLNLVYVNQADTHGLGVGELSAEQQQERRAEENSRMSLRQLQAAHFFICCVQVEKKATRL